MTPQVQWSIGAGLALAGWLATRIVARAGRPRPFSLALDMAVPALGFVAFSVITARPIFAGMLIFALIGGLAFADYAKRLALREPVLFCDMSELVELFRHPQLYLPYAGTGRIIAGALAAVAAVGLLIWLEPPAFRWMPGDAILAMALIAMAILAPATVLLRPAGRAMTRFAPSGEPARDAAKFGAMATLLIHGVIARAERASRRAALKPTAMFATGPGDGPPVVMVQSESFFDARRLGAMIAPDLLPAFDAACAQGLSGRLATPAWGANTVRTEFEAITGHAGPRLGFDRFNPYHAFVRQPVSSLAWALKARGYKTICLHPYDRRFYARDKVMENLGFDIFLGQEAFPPAEPGAYITDAQLAEVMTRTLEQEGRGVFIFAITMENHGPWPARDGMADPAPSLADIAEGASLKRYAQTLRGADAMIGVLRPALGPDGLLAFYGDHLPSLPKAFDALGFTQETTDYFVVRADRPDGRVADLAAHDLPSAIISALDAPARDLS